MSPEKCSKWLKEMSPYGQLQRISSHMKKKYTGDMCPVHWNPFGLFCTILLKFCEDYYSEGFLKPFLLIGFCQM